MQRTRRQTAITELAQQLADAALMQIDAKMPSHAVAQVNPAEPHAAIGREVRPLVHPGGNLGPLGLRQTRRPTTPRSIGKPVQPGLVVAMHPVPQRLPVHAAGLRGILAAEAVHHHGNRKHPPGALVVRNLLGRRAQLSDRQIRSGNRYRSHASLRESMQRLSTHIPADM